MNKIFTKLAVLIFGVVALIHLCRLFTHFSVIVNGYEIPYWVSVPGVIIAGALSFGLWKDSKK